MKWFLNLSTRAKLFVGFGAFVLCMAIVTAVAYSAITQIQKTDKGLFENEFILVQKLLELRADLNQQRADIQQMMLETNRTDQETIEKDLNALAGQADGIIQDLFQMLRDDRHLLQGLQDLETIRREYKQAREAQIRDIYAGRIDEARKLSLGAQADRYRKIRLAAMDLGNAATERAKMGIANSEQRAHGSTRLLAVLAVAALLIGLMLSVLLSRIISRPIQQISRAAEKIATGDLTTSVSFDHRADEIGSLAQAFGRMTDNLRRHIGSLSEGVNVLVSSANQISTSAAQVAASSAGTATAVGETTATVEEVKQTAQVSSQKAKSVSETAQRAAQVAQTGRKSTEASVDGMKRIQTQMESIADSVVKLSEQGQAIGEIIATVNDLAEQSNLLAVNAAIEASKAGDQGKGFAVVAQEVKNLAEQSKQATAQVRAILGDIQKATTGAVLATEQGSKAVEAGVKQSAEAGDAIKSLADTIIEAAQAATQIAASSQQQVVGTDQVAQAMENIKQASAQNAAGTRQTETAAYNLREVGEKLKKLVDQYKV